MLEILEQRRTELEVAAKNAIVEIFVIEEQMSAIEGTLKNKRKNVDNINASLRELLHVTSMLEDAEEVVE